MGTAATPQRFAARAVLIAMAFVTLTACLTAYASAAHAAEDALDAPACQTPSPAVAATLLSEWQTALASRHPDKVTRLFSSEGTVHGFYAPSERSGYASIRDYFVHFLVTEPEADLSTLTVNTGCGIIVAEGRTVWSQSAVPGKGETKTSVRLLLIFVDTTAGWRLQHFADTRNDDPVNTPNIAAAPQAPRKPAVAGFVRRTQSATAVNPATPAAPSGSTGYKAGRWDGDAPVFD